MKRIPSPIPQKKWYLNPAVISIMGGLLPFGSIFIEMYFLWVSAASTSAEIGGM